MALPKTLLRLWELAGGDPFDSSCDWNRAFDAAGLILLAPPRRFEYWCTPLNSLTFATTGGDGVHYGLLDVNGEFTDFSPVVMTVPMCEAPNTIVGANLKEFLALGCRYGYFSLEQLVYQRAQTLEELSRRRANPVGTPEERSLLDRLSSEFGLQPWLDPEHRLLELHAAFLGSVQQSPLSHDDAA
jgi:hypothetical protein